MKVIVPTPDSLPNCVQCWVAGEGVKVIVPTPESLLNCVQCWVAGMV